jgi:hypothetical protein
MALQTIPARLVATENVTPSGVGGIVDAEIVEDADVVLLTNQTSPAENGLRVVGAGTWARHADFATNTQMLKGTTFFISDGSPNNAGSEWFFSIANPDPSGITVDADALYFDRRSWPIPVEAGAGVEVDGGAVSLPERFGVEGTWDFPRITATDEGISDSVFNTPGTEGFIAGLGYKVSSAGTLTINEGAAWQPGTNSVLHYLSGVPTVDATIAASGLAYLYIRTSMGVDGIYLSPTPPDTPYFADIARTLPTDTTWRYFGAVRTLAGGVFAACSFNPVSGLLSYLEDTTASPFRVESGSATQTNRTVGLGSVAGTSGTAYKLVPPTSRTALLNVRNNGTVQAWFGNSEDSTNPQARTGVRAIAASREKEIWMPLDANQSFEFSHAAAGGIMFIDVLGYVERR